MNGLSSTYCHCGSALTAACIGGGSVAAAASRSEVKISAAAGFIAVRPVRRVLLPRRDEHQVAHVDHRREVEVAAGS